ncbi:methionine adenosyltransferase [Listeria seeligeri]|uniref:methionine adenosyltransferase n=1 Tax=Listeria seeligeri TaxID=1640 RepID=UPI0001C4E31E|nr:methionine adenosyltransferase [Listeria seeligeri]MBC1722334.1 methionine adenosyltransferase [Listeria seeligeri]MBF2345347.1 methionine adenosyltransferase [Listeria seeligeri]MBF2435861.1 methionine adenosyltransferase [Listeria seeligeri]MBF2480190.1 methionine adenosyltransferase [Listeria seeligeri]MBF2599316.1 methionine adenosyltransferase [Listeria seeligeri]
MGHIVINQMQSNLRDSEIVERKGIGHPDTICDAIAEKCSKNYSLYFYNKYKKFGHHWFDKVILIGGESNIDFGAGEIIKPYKIIVAGKCVKSVGNEKVPLMEIFKASCKEVLDECLTGFDIEHHLIIIDETVNHQGAGRKKSRYQPESIEDLAVIDASSLVSNDCNLLSSHYPLTLMENIVLDIESYINGSQFKSAYPQTGWDVKVIGLRNKDEYELLINIPILAKAVSSIEEYKEVVSDVGKHLESYLQNLYKVDILLNINPQDKTDNPYLTVLGSAADTGDVGVVGRGNRINGLITPMQSMSIEAPAGKNPLDHTGKIYGLATRELAQIISENIGRQIELHVYTYKEAPIQKPAQVIVNITDGLVNELEIKKIQTLINDRFNSIDSTIETFIFSETTLW